MTRDVCTCGHLAQSHDGPCHAPECACEVFVSEDGPDVVVVLDVAA